MAAPLMGRRPKRKAVPQRDCMGCKRPTGTTWKWLCDACFGLLPAPRKTAICLARADRAPHRIFWLSRDAAQWLADQGHVFPQAEAAE